MSLRGGMTGIVGGDTGGVRGSVTFCPASLTGGVLHPQRLQPPPISGTANTQDRAQVSKCSVRELVLLRWHLGVSWNWKAWPLLSQQRASLGPGVRAPTAAPQPGLCQSSCALPAEPGQGSWSCRSEATGPGGETKEGSEFTRRRGQLYCHT